MIAPITIKAIAFIESKTPNWLKVVIALFIIGWMTPLEVRDWFYDKIDTRVHAVITPMKVARDYEIKDMNQRIDRLTEKTNETNAFVRAMALEQLGAKRYQEIDLTTVDKTK